MHTEAHIRQNSMITVNLELSKQLKEAGYPQENHEFYWLEQVSPGRSKTYPDGMFRLVRGKETSLPEQFVFASPTADEILEQLPAQIKNKRLQIDKMPAGEFCISYIPFNASDQEEIVVFGTTPSLADAAAKMWLYLKKEGLL